MSADLLPTCTIIEHKATNLSFTIEKYSDNLLPSIISPKTDQHDTRLPHLAFRLKLHFGGNRFHCIPLDNCVFITACKLLSR